MARRRLLTGDERQRLFDPPVEEIAIIGHYTLSAEDVELVGRRYGPANRLGLAAQIALMRHPGVGTQNGPRYTLRFCRAFDGAHLAKRSERGGWRIGIGPEVIAGEIDMLPTER
jgi:Domain of unknown function (DUF4158)